MRIDQGRVVKRPRCMQIDLYAKRLTTTMACQDAEPPNAGETNETVARSKRAIKLTPKVLQNAVEDKQREIMKSHKRLLSVMKLVEELSEDSEIETVAHDLAVASEEFVRPTFTRSSCRRSSTR